MPHLNRRAYVSSWVYKSQIPTTAVLCYFYHLSFLCCRFEAAKPAVSATAAAEDPFEGLPFKKLADRLGAAMSPVVQAVRLFLHPTCQDNLTCFFALGPSSMVRETCSVGHF